MFTAFHALSCAASLSFSAIPIPSFNLRGIVRNRAYVPVANALVVWNQTLVDTTDEHGAFRIVWTNPTGNSFHAPKDDRQTFYRPGEGVRFELLQPGEVSLRVRNMRGELVRSARSSLAAGPWTLPLDPLPVGTYFGQLDANGRRSSFRFTTVQALSGSRHPVAVSSPIPNASFRSAAEGTLGELTVWSTGYRTTKFPITSLTDTTMVLVINAIGGSDSTAASEGCGKAATRPDPASKQTLSVSGTNRTYLLYLPTNYSNTIEYPVIFAFHGGGGNGAAARNDFKLEAAANNGAIMVYPDGGWNYGTGTDVAFFDAILKDMNAKYCINTKRVFVTGFSLGGIFVNGLGCLRGGTTVRAIIPVAGSGPNPNMAPAQADIACPAGTPPSVVPTMIIHGTADANALYKYGQWEAEFWRQWNSTTEATTTSPAPYSGCVDYVGGLATVRFCTHSGGHVVPSWTGQYVWNFAQSLP